MHVCKTTRSNFTPRGLASLARRAEPGGRLRAHLGGASVKLDAIEAELGHSDDVPEVALHPAAMVGADAVVEVPAARHRTVGRARR